MKIVRYSLLLAGISLLIWACSTEKNTFVNRSYHTVTAHYNGYFNATLLVDEAINSYENSLQENYYELLPIEPVPDEKEVIGLYPALDTAIAKCTEVIKKHSMPSNDRPSKKKEEHNGYIDENWTLIGIASYYRRDYEGAMKNFKFIRKFYDNDPSLYIGELWMAKTNLRMGNLTEAQFNVDNLDKALKEQEEEGKKFFNFKKDKDEEKAEFPKEIRFDFELTKADLALAKNQPDEAITYLENSLKFAKKSQDKARVNFILGQLYEKAGRPQDAKKKYKKVLRYNGRFEMLFNARIKKAVLGGTEDTKKELKKMLRDAKNAEYKDQIYYGLAQIELNEGNREQGKVYLTQSAFYSVSNGRQKGMAYEKLGDMAFEERNYVSAQKYYDSTASVIPEDYPNAEGIRRKAENLSNLVVAVETAAFEDSVQRIAQLSEGEREKFVKDVIKQIKEEEAERKKREAERLLQLQQNQNLFVQNQSGNKWYWNNAKTRAEGYDEFKRMWGQRENEDDWRRSQKINFANAFNEIDDSTAFEDTSAIAMQQEDTLTVDRLLQNVPLTDSAMTASNDRLVKAYYDAGIIYKDQLNEPKFASSQFTAVIDHNYESEYNVMSAFQLYKMNEVQDPVVASTHKSYILDNYPNSDYANYLRDPDFFVKRKELQALQEQEYITVLERYNRGLYYPVIARANVVIDEEKDNRFRAKYMLLKAMSLGQTSSNKLMLKPVLEQVVAEYPDTEEATRAGEMLDIIENGYSKNIEANFEKSSVYTYEDDKHYVIIFLEPKASSASPRSNVVSFNREYFSRDGLNASSKIYDLENDQSIVLVQEFETDLDAMEYIRVFKSTRNHVGSMHDLKIFAISPKNLQTLFSTRKLTEYETFYDEYY